jgi:hypothetical protein
LADNVPVHALIFAVTVKMILPLDFQSRVFYCGATHAFLYGVLCVSMRFEVF